MKNIAIFASGNGTNAERIIKYFEDSNLARVTVILTNNSKAGVIKRVQALFIDVHIISRNDFYNSNKVEVIIEQYNVDLIVLAGFLWLVPENLINSYKNRMINIHPALLPRYGGKGMYGMKVHEAIVNSGDTFSGITIHKVSNNYDEGQIIFQVTVEISKNETPQSLAEKIHLLEYEHFPRVIKELVTG